jgi:hypothetical protein
VGGDDSGGSSFWDEFWDDFFEADRIYGAFGLFEAGYGAWHGFVNLSRANIEYGQTVRGLGDVDLSIEETVIDAGIGYDVTTRPDLKIAPFFGGRYARADLEASAASIGSLSTDIDRLFPIVGVSARYELSPSWWLAGAADVGLIGGDETWSAYALVGYRVAPFGLPASLILGYRALKLDVTEASPNQSVDVLQHGFIFGLNFRIF